MFAPVAVISEWGEGINFLVAFLIGIGFGFAVERGGMGNSRKLAMEFYFRDMSVFKIMFTAIITAMFGIILFSSIGWLNVDIMYVNPTYLWPGIAGGLIMGFGFILSGYCPGVSVAGAATLKIDSYFYIAGILIGMFLFGELTPYIEEFFSGKYSGFMGRVTLYQFFGISAGIMGFIVVMIALAGFWGAEKLEKKFNSKISQSESSGAVS